MMCVSGVSLFRCWESDSDWVIRYLKIPVDLSIGILVLEFR
ncbi:hypothetical protein H1P_10056 [Hyella patelloides LEGE 07179]|uniref:Uncharacterized protein n=1 Tax=Hyella patelloides LEGE 07179 TaxID=945734 RepID=A0A563VIQ8_9CYAN|nr:hypothetical protein H1P_10056 [Hyella patelloides LEGE 07179]